MADFSFVKNKSFYLNQNSIAASLKQRAIQEDQLIQFTLVDKEGTETQDIEMIFQDAQGSFVKARLKEMVKEHQYSLQVHFFQA